MRPSSPHAAAAAAAAGLRNIAALFGSAHLISLRRRTDRRRRIEAQLASMDLSLDELGITVFDALEYDSPAGFPNSGVRGCFNSHKALLERCASRGQPALILEDDVRFDVKALAAASELIAQLSEMTWDIIYFGRVAPRRAPRGLRYESGPTIGGHFYGIKPSMAGEIARFMQDCETRPAGHPAGGPMYRDAAFNFLRARNPNIKTLVLDPPLAEQFSSRTDLGGQRIWDKITVLRPAVDRSRALAQAAREALPRSRN